MRSMSLLQEMVDWDAEKFAELTPAVMRRVAANVAGLNTEEGLATFERECPRSSIGAFVIRWLYNARKAGAALVAMHAAEKALEEAQAALQSKQEAVAVARKEDKEADALAGSIQAAIKMQQGLSS